MKRKKGKYYKDYIKERKRIQSFIYRQKKKGYIIPEGLLPKIPKRITLGSLNRLRKLTVDVLYKKLEYYDLETGEILKGKKPKQKKQKKQKEKVINKLPNADDIIINNVLSELQKYVPSSSQSRFLSELKKESVSDIENMIFGAINLYGKNVVARRLEKESVKVHKLIITIMVSSDSKEIGLSVTELMQIIYNGALSLQERSSIDNAMEYTQDFT
jgi:hypothetical protein